MAALAAFISTRYRFFAATLKRFQHTGIRLILVLFGAQLAGGANFLSLLEGIIFMLAFMLIQAENDYYDKELDAATLRASSITQDDLIFVRVFMALLALIFWFIQPLFSILLVIFFLLGFVYNHPAFCFKKYFITASLVEGGAAFIGMFAGVFSAGNSLDGTDILWITGVALIFAVLANIRDYKDFIGDKKMGIKTLYVTLQARGVAPQKTHFALIGFSIFIHIVVVAFSLYLHLALPLIVIGFLLLIASPFPFLLISHPKKSASSTSTVAQAGLLLLFVAFGMLPAFSHQYPHHPEIIREQPQELPPAY
jgi:4-hydroxybenzoate polyprenyltransferase